MSRKSIWNVTLSCYCYCCCRWTWSCFAVYAKPGLATAPFFYSYYALLIVPKMLSVVFTLIFSILFKVLTTVIEEQIPMETAAISASQYQIFKEFVGVLMEWSWLQIIWHVLKIHPMSHPLCSVAPTHFPVVMEDVCLDTISVMVLMIAMTTVMNKTVVPWVSNPCDLQLGFLVCSSGNLMSQYGFIGIYSSFLGLHLCVNAGIFLGD